MWPLWLKEGFSSVPAGRCLSLSGMPAKQDVRISAKQLDEEYGDVLRAPPFSDKTTPRQILRTWETTYPDVCVTEGVFRTWFDKHRAAADLEVINGYTALEERVGDTLRQLQGEGHASSFKLVRELRGRVGLNTTDAVMKEWIRHHGGGAPSWCFSAQNLEQLAGQRLREHLSRDSGAVDADSIKQWLADQQVSCSIRIIRHWLDADFGHQGRLDSGEALEHAIGDILRLTDYAHFFESEESKCSLVEHLRSLDPPVCCTLDVLSAWYAAFYARSGGRALEAESARDLDRLLGDDRVHYALDGARPMIHHLASRWQPIRATHMVCRVWLETVPDELKAAAKARGAPKVLNARRLRHKTEVALPELRTHADVERVLGQVLRDRYLKFGFGHTQTEGVRAVQGEGHVVGKRTYQARGSDAKRAIRFSQTWTGVHVSPPCPSLWVGPFLTDPKS